jgi:hypothetical protein
MKVRALISFSGLVSMRKGEVKEIRDKDIVADLLRAGYIGQTEKPKTKKSS